MTPTPPTPEGTPQLGTSPVRAEGSAPSIQTPGAGSSVSIPVVKAASASAVGPTAAAAKDLTLSKPSTAAGVSTAKQPAGDAAAKPVVRGSKAVRTLGERCEIVLTSLPTVWSVGIASVALVLWVLVAELPRTFEMRLVSARTNLDETQKAAEEASQHGTIDQSVLSNQVARAQRFLIPDRDQFVSLVSDIEKMAKAAGLQADISSSPNVDRTPVAPEVSVLASLLRIQASNAKYKTNGVPIYSRLLPFLDKLDQLTNKVEITSMAVVGDRFGAVSAQLELQFWLRKADEKASGK